MAVSLFGPITGLELIRRTIDVERDWFELTVIVSVIAFLISLMALGLVPGYAC